MKSVAAFLYPYSRKIPRTLKGMRNFCVRLGTRELFFLAIFANVNYNRRGKGVIANIRFLKRFVDRKVWRFISVRPL